MGPNFSYIRRSIRVLSVNKSRALICRKPHIGHRLPSYRFICVSKKYHGNIFLSPCLFICHIWSGLNKSGFFFEQTIFQLNRTIWGAMGKNCRVQLCSNEFQIYRLLFWPLHHDKV